MTTQQIVALIFSSALTSSLLSVLLSHFLNRNTAKDSRLFDLKREAYSQVVSVVVGADDTLISYLTSQSKTDSVRFLDYLTKLQEKIAPARLISPKEMNEKLNAIAPLMVRGFEIYGKLVKLAKKNELFDISPNEPEAIELKNWSEEWKRLETEILLLIKNDLGFKAKD